MWMFWMLLGALIGAHAGQKKGFGALYGAVSGASRRRNFLLYFAPSGGARSRTSCDEWISARASARSASARRVQQLRRRRPAAGRAGHAADGLQGVAREVEDALLAHHHHGFCCSARPAAGRRRRPPAGRHTTPAAALPEVRPGAASRQRGPRPGGPGSAVGLPDLRRAIRCSAASPASLSGGSRRRRHARSGCCRPGDGQSGETVPSTRAQRAAARSWCGCRNTMAPRTVTARPSRGRTVPPPGASSQRDAEPTRAARHHVGDDPDDGRQGKLGIHHLAARPAPARRRSMIMGTSRLQVAERQTRCLPAEHGTAISCLSGATT